MNILINYSSTKSLKLNKIAVKACNHYTIQKWCKINIYNQNTIWNNIRDLYKRGIL